MVARPEPVTWSWLWNPTPRGAARARRTACSPSGVGGSERSAAAAGEQTSLPFAEGARAKS